MMVRLEHEYSKVDNLPGMLPHTFYLSPITEKENERKVYIILDTIGMC